MIWPLRQGAGQESMPDIWLEQPRVILRPPRSEDWHEWASVRMKNQDFLRPFEPVWPDDCLTKDFFLRRLRRQSRDWRNGRGNSFLIIRKEGNRLIGGVNINHICRGAAQYGSLGYWLDRDHLRCGYMSESLRAVASYAFGMLALHRLNAACLLDNEASYGLLLKLGFVEEGLARRYVKINGRWQDHRLFGLCAEDWVLPPDSGAPGLA